MCMLTVQLYISTSNLCISCFNPPITYSFSTTLLP
jgi:hypothetical protein